MILPPKKSVRKYIGNNRFSVIRVLTKIFLFFLQQISLYFLNKANLLQMIYKWNDTNTWTLSKDWSNSYPADSNTSIGASWLPCQGCYHHEVVVLQNSSNTLQMANRSTNGLMVPLPGGYQTKGTPISLAPVMVKGQQRINLYSYAGEILEVLFDSPSNSTEDLLKNSP